MSSSTFVLYLLGKCHEIIATFLESGIWRQSESVSPGHSYSCLAKEQAVSFPVRWTLSQHVSLVLFYFLQRSWDSGEFRVLRGRQSFNLRSEDQVAISKTRCRLSPGMIFLPLYSYPASLASPSRDTEGCKSEANGSNRQDTEVSS